MAKKRDSLICSTEHALKHNLEREYLSIYKVASSIVHADSSSLSFTFLDLFPSPSGQPVLMAVPTWAMIVVASTAHYDILQCYEILTWLGIEVQQEYKNLMDQWLEARDRYIS